MTFGGPLHRVKNNYLISSEGPAIRNYQRRDGIRRDGEGEKKHRNERARKERLQKKGVNFDGGIGSKRVGKGESECDAINWRSVGLGGDDAIAMVCGEEKETGYSRPWVVGDYWETGGGREATRREAYAKN